MNEVISSYKTLSESCSFELKESKSRFVAIATPSQTIEDAMNLYAGVRKEYYDAAHFPFAYRLKPAGELYRYSDDGEPSGSGGKPVYDALVKHELANSMLVVVRYFGGVKLGVGGLKRAFFETADQCLSYAKIREVIITERLQIQFEYKYISAMMKLIEDDGVKISENKSEEECLLVLDVPVSIADEFRKKLLTVSNGSVKTDNPIS